MMYWHFNADAKVAEWGSGSMLDEIKRKEGEEKKGAEERRKRRWRVVTNAQERFGRLSKTFIIFDANYQTP